MDHSARSRHQIPWGNVAQVEEPPRDGRSPKATRFERPRRTMSCNELTRAAGVSVSSCSLIAASSGNLPDESKSAMRDDDIMQTARGSNHECRSARQQLRSTYVETDHWKTAAQRLNDNETCLLVHARKEEDVSVRPHHVKHSIVGQPPDEANAMIDMQTVSEAAEARFIGPAANQDESPSFRRGDSSDRDRYPFSGSSRPTNRAVGERSIDSGVDRPGFLSRRAFGKTTALLRCLLGSQFLVSGFCTRMTRASRHAFLAKGFA